MADMKEVEGDLIAKAGATLGVVVAEDVAGKPTCPILCPMARDLVCQVPHFRHGAHRSR